VKSSEKPCYSLVGGCHSYDDMWWLEVRRAKVWVGGEMDRRKGEGDGLQRRKARWQWTDGHGRCSGPIGGGGGSRGETRLTPQRHKSSQPSSDHQAQASLELASRLSA
jgi:DNA modification methylase